LKSPATLPATHDLLLDLYRAAIAAAAPGPALAARLRRLPQQSGRRVWIIALGKAALPMATTAADVLGAGAGQLAGGLIVAPEGSASPDPRITLCLGDHPEPDARSLTAAMTLADVTAQVDAGDEIWVLLSGGTTSLIGAPEPGLTPADLRSLYALLLGSGLDITAMNQIRKRFSRWGAGKLARALYPALVRVYIVSDVIGDDLASIGSGPCVPDPTTARDIHGLLERAGLWPKVPEAARRIILSVESGETAETPKPGDRAFARVTLELVASNRLALEAAAKRAAELGLAPDLVEVPLAGEAVAAGASVADNLLNNCVRLSIPQPMRRRLCRIWGGETTVSLGDHPTGLGGRSQELALAAARTLDGAREISLLAAGTDGRDGPTDAAGAIVDGTTWTAISAAGRDPAQDLAGHDAYPALASVGALVKPGLTGTNVMDIVIGICGNDQG
jgi:hydroxypyruvate reductase